MKKSGFSTGLLTLLPAFALLFFASCSNLKSPEYRDIRNLHVAKWDFNRPTVQLDVVYYNPNSIGFQFKGASVDLYIDTLFLGHSVLDTTIKVDPHAEFIIPLSVDMDLKQLLKNGLQSYLNREVLVKVNGYVKGSKAGIMKKFPINYSGKHQLNLKLF